MRATIPTFGADGRRLRDRTQEAIEHLVSLSLVVVERNRRGAIRSAHFRPTSGANPVRQRAHQGTKYSFEQILPSGHKAWKHRALLQSQQLEELLGIPVTSERELDDYLKSIFRAVPLSIMATRTPGADRPVRSKVVSIESGRKQKRTQAARPIEFDSERRAA